MLLSKKHYLVTFETGSPLLMIRNKIKAQIKDDISKTYCILKIVHESLKKIGIGIQ